MAGLMRYDGVCNAVAMFKLSYSAVTNWLASWGRAILRTVDGSQKRILKVLITIALPIMISISNIPFPYILTKKGEHAYLMMLSYTYQIYRCRHYDGICDPLPVALELGSRGVG